MAHSPIDDAAARLSQVTDDLTPRQECKEWLICQMREGRDPDALLAELLANGWTQDDVQPLIDEARQQSRGTRGVTGERDQGSRAGASAVIRRQGGLLGTAILAAARSVEKQIGQEAEVVRHRIKHGLCHKCGFDINSSIDRCPQCGSAIVRRQI